MKLITVTKTHRLDQLADELFAAFPAWRAVGPDGQTRTAVSVTSNGSAVTLIVPDETDEAAVLTAINAHTPNPEYTAQPLVRQAKRYLRNTIVPLFQNNQPVGNLQPGTTEYNMHKAVIVLIANLYSGD